VGLENQLLEAKSSQLRADKAAAAAAAAAAKLEAQLAKLTQRSDESSAELAGLTSERRILKARLMQAEARLRAAGLEPLPPLPQGRGGAAGGCLGSEAGFWAGVMRGGGGVNGCVLVCGQIHDMHSNARDANLKPYALFTVAWAAFTPKRVHVQT
jgi:multidrug efflux pump subunit AcrA (membrane-fusion protein)